MHTILNEDSFVLPPDMAREYTKTVGYIKNADIVKLRTILIFFQNLRDFTCPDSGHNLIGVAIHHSAPIGVIKTLIELEVSINGERDGGKIPLNIVPFVNTQPEQFEATYELIRAGARYDFCGREDILWLDDCQKCNPRLYATISRAIIDRARYTGKFEEPSDECLRNKKHQKIFFDARLAAELRRVEIKRNREELLELKPKILTAKDLAEVALREEDGCSIQMQVVDQTVDFSIQKTGVIRIDQHLKHMFNRSVKKFKAAKRIVNVEKDNMEANRVLTLYYRNGWGGAKLNPDLAETHSNISATSSNISSEQATTTLFRRKRLTSI